MWHIKTPDWAYAALDGLYDRWYALTEWADQTYRSAVCRLRGHPGVTWFNANGLEPNMECTRCGEDLG